MELEFRPGIWRGILVVVVCLTGACCEKSSTGDERGSGGRNERETGNAAAELLSVSALERADREERTRCIQRRVPGESRWRVEASGGDTVPRASVIASPVFELWREGMPKSSVPIEVDAQGEFEIPSEFRGFGAWLEVTAPGFMSTKLGLTADETGSGIGCRVALVRASSVRFTITGERSAEVEYCTLVRDIPEVSAADSEVLGNVCHRVSNGLLFGIAARRSELGWWVASGVPGQTRLRVVAQLSGYTFRRLTPPVLVDEQTGVIELRLEW